MEIVVPVKEFMAMDLIELSWTHVLHALGVPSHTVRFDADARGYLSICERFFPEESGPIELVPLGTSVIGCAVCRERLRKPLNYLRVNMKRRDYLIEKRYSRFSPEEETRPTDDPEWAAEVEQRCKSNLTWKQHKELEELEARYRQYRDIIQGRWAPLPVGV